jgi:hypothetical protein
MNITLEIFASGTWLAVLQLMMVEQEVLPPRWCTIRAGRDSSRAVADLPGGRPLPQWLSWVWIRGGSNAIEGKNVAVRRTLYPVGRGRSCRKLAAGKQTATSSQANIFDKDFSFRRIVQHCPIDNTGAGTPASLDQTGVGGCIQKGGFGWWIILLCRHDKNPVRSERRPPPD